MKKVLSLKEFEDFAIRTWAVWKERMKLCHGNCKKLNIMDVEWSGLLLSEYQAARVSLMINKSDECATSSVRWSKPMINHLRLDVDAVFQEHTNNYSVGGVLRNHEGQVVLAFGLKITKPPSVVFGELITIKEGLGLVRDKGLEVQDVYSDSLLAVQAVVNPKENYSYIGAIAKEVKKLLNYRHSIKLRNCRRSANIIAHKLAVFAISSPFSFVWEAGMFFFWLVNLVIDDLNF
ncbi:uncharacterized protein [Henckelia pumila]|uniref:uncharacterized protein n=1 Tax=Henckelia pumila TaxID=405737 RepID=UPI003C6DC92C